MKYHCRFVLLILLTLFTGGCRPSLPYLQVAPLPPGSICRVAVLPFQSESDFLLANTLVYKVFSAELQAADKYLLVQEGDILKVYQQLRILPGQVPSLEELQIVANRLDAQLLITGNVLELRETPGQLAGADPVLALEIRIHDGRNGTSLWHTYHRRHGTDYRTAMHFGTLHTVTGLSEQVSREIINLWFKEGLTPCDASP